MQWNAFWEGGDSRTCLAWKAKCMRGPAYAEFARVLGRGLAGDASHDGLPLSPASGPCVMRLQRMEDAMDMNADVTAVEIDDALVSDRLAEEMAGILSRLAQDLPEGSEKEAATAYLAEVDAGVHAGDPADLVAGLVHEINLVAPQGKAFELAEGGTWRFVDRPGAAPARF